jgi:hypothetical protein
LKENHKRSQRNVIFVTLHHCICTKEKKKILRTFPSFKDLKKTPKPPNFSTNNICAEQTMNVKKKKKEALFYFMTSYMVPMGDSPFGKYSNYFLFKFW